MKRSLLITILIAFVTLGIWGSTPKSVNISGLRTNHNVSQDGNTCMAPEFKLNVNGYKGKDLNVVVYFFDENWNKLKDLNDKYHTTDGQVSVSKTINPGYDNTEYSNLKIYIPTKELHSDPGTKDYYYYAVVWKGNDEIGRSPGVRFSATKVGNKITTGEPHFGKPEASISSVTIEPGSTVEGKTALKVNMSGTLKKLRGEKAYMAIWIYDQNGNSYKTHASNKANDGTPFFKWEVVPETDDYSFSTWYAPFYDKLNLKSGRNNYKLIVSLHSPDGKLLASSNMYDFSANGPTGNGSTGSGSNASSSSRSSSSSSSSAKASTSSGNSKSTATKKRKGTKFYAVQTIYSTGAIEAGGLPEEFEFDIAGRMAAVATIDGDIMTPASLSNYPALINWVNQAKRNYSDADGLFLISNDGYRLYYVDTDRGMANIYQYMYPGAVNSLLCRTYYSTDPSKAGSGDSGYINLNPTLGDSETTTTRSEYVSENCPKCHGRKWRPESYAYAAEADAYHWRGGSGCSYCSRVTDHYHYKCHYCDAAGKVSRRK